jgi:RNA polymerase sigma factor (sigma-70 family)
MDDPQEQSEEHVQLSRDANRPRLERLLRDLWPWIRKKAKWMVSRKLAPLGVSSLTQETAFRFSRSADAMRASEEPAVKALLSRIMENTAKDSYRAQNRVKRDNKRQLLSEMLPQDTSSAEDAYQMQEQQRQLEDAIAQLPPRHQRALAMYVEGRTFDEIAQELDCTVPAARMLIHRAKSELRTLLADAHDSLGNHGG